MRLGLVLGLGGCTQFLPYGGPRTSAVTAAPENTSLHGIELVKVNYAIADALRQAEADKTFSSVFAGPDHPEQAIAPGDVLQIYIWEAPPAVLFAPPLTADGAVGGSLSAVTLPNQVVDNEGDVSVPFAGLVPVAGDTPEQAAAKIAGLLEGQANRPQVLVARTENNTQDITVIGDVSHSMDVPLTPGGVRLLRALAEAGGVTAPVDKVTIQLSRAGVVDTLPLETVLKNPAENIPLRAGDVVAALYQPLSVTVLGATGTNNVINFDNGDTTLADVLAKSGGINDNLANPAGVFVFRFEDAGALNWPVKPSLLVHGKVPAIFEFDMRDPATFFAAQTFEMRDQDLVYVSDAPVADLQKVLNVVGAIVYPFATLNNFGILK